MPRILCLSYEYPPIGGGGGVVAETLAEALGPYGYEIDVVTSHLDGLPELEESGHVTVHRVRCHRIHRHYSNLFELGALLVPIYRKARKLASQNQYLFNHTHFALPTGLIAHRLRAETGIPYALTLHGSDVPGYNPDRFGLSHVLLRPFWTKVLSDASLIVSPSEFLAKLTKQRLDLPITTIPNGFTPTAQQYPPKKNCVLVVSRMFQRKGVQFFLEAIKDWSTDWEILIAGDGPYLPKLQRMARRIVPRITFTGLLGRQELARLYGAARIFVFPSVQENFPVVLLEAMHAGCAIVTTDAQGCAEVVGNAAIKTRSGDAKSIREALDRFVSNPLEIDRYARAARERSGDLLWPKVAKRYHEAFVATFGTPVPTKTASGTEPHERARKFVAAAASVSRRLET